MAEKITITGSDGVRKVAVDFYKRTSPSTGETAYYLPVKKDGYSYKDGLGVDRKTDTGLGAMLAPIVACINMNRGILNHQANPLGIAFQTGGTDKQKAVLELLDYVKSKDDPSKLADRFGYNAVQNSPLAQVMGRRIVAADTGNVTLPEGEYRGIAAGALDALAGFLTQASVLAKQQIESGTYPKDSASLNCLGALKGLCQRFGHGTVLSPQEKTAAESRRFEQSMYRNSGRG